MFVCFPFRLEKQERERERDTGVLWHIENKNAPYQHFQWNMFFTIHITDTHRALCKSQKRINLSMCLKKKLKKKKKKLKLPIIIIFFFCFKIILRVSMNICTLIFYFHHYCLAVLMIYLHYQNLTGYYQLLIMYYYVLYP